jgi:hypothetical protein
MARFGVGKRLAIVLLGAAPFGLPAKAKQLSMSDSDEGGETESQSATGFDRYRSLLEPTLTIMVAADEVPPFRFKAGGWELLQSSIEVGAAIKARIAEKGFFLFRVNEDLSGGVELSEPPTLLEAERDGETT